MPKHEIGTLKVHIPQQLLEFRWILDLLIPKQPLNTKNNMQGDSYQNHKEQLHKWTQVTLWVRVAFGQNEVKLLSRMR